MDTLQPIMFFGILLTVVQPVDSLTLNRVIPLGAPFPQFIAQYNRTTKDDIRITFTSNLTGKTKTVDIFNEFDSRYATAGYIVQTIGEHVYLYFNSTQSLFNAAGIYCFMVLEQFLSCFMMNVHGPLHCQPADDGHSVQFEVHYAGYMEPRMSCTNKVACSNPSIGTEMINGTWVQYRSWNCEPADQALQHCMLQLDEADVISAIQKTDLHPRNPAMNVPELSGACSEGKSQAASSSNLLVQPHPCTVFFLAICTYVVLVL